MPNSRYSERTLKNWLCTGSPQRVEIYDRFQMKVGTRLGLNFRRSPRYVGQVGFAFSLVC